jgi:hypothetical protein
MMQLFDSTNTDMKIEDTTKSVLEFLPKFKQTWMTNTTVRLTEGTLLYALDNLLSKKNFERSHALGLVRKVWGMSDDMAKIYLHLGLNLNDVDLFQEKIITPISITGLDRLPKETNPLLIVSSLFSNQVHLNQDAAKAWIMKHLSRSHAAETVVKTLMGG